MRVDLNADVGESFGAWRMGDDLALLDIVTSANIACGFHAGDPLTMTRTVAAALAQGITIEGPRPPDTAFLPQRRAATDAYVCMYHDQGLIPLKALAFDSAINTTLGLPLVRTSVDHGTAFDIAWQGTANPNSLYEAILLAARLAGRRKK